LAAGRVVGIDTRAASRGDGEVIQDLRTITSIDLVARSTEMGKVRALRSPTYRPSDRT
jgi:hypothetical protein